MPVQYADYTLWQQAVLGDEDDGSSVLSRQLSFWTAALRICRIRSSCRATGRGRRWRATAAGGWRCASMPSLHRGLSALARGAGRACSWCCRRRLPGCCRGWAAATDIAIGSPIAGRTDAALDDLIGFFVNTLVLRTDTSGNPSFAELIGRVRAHNLAAYGHAELPFERLVEVLNPARSLSRHPLFQVMLAFEAGASGGWARAAGACGAA